jgi:hypothetical protein
LFIETLTPSAQMQSAAEMASMMYVGDLRMRGDATQPMTPTTTTTSSDMMT